MTTKKPSAVQGLRRGVGAAAPEIGRASADLPPEIQQSMPDLPPRRPRPAKPEKIRFTLDLDQARHSFLKQFALHRDANASEVVRALLDELQEDPDLAIRVRARIWQR